MITTAVILAAGLGSRLGDRTKETPKGLIRVGGQSLVEQSIEKLFAAGIGRVVIGTGYLSAKYEDLAGHFPGVELHENPRYRDTGSMYTLSNLRGKIDGDFLLLESDLLYEARGLVALLEDPRRNVLLASGRTCSNDEVFIEVDEDACLVDMSKDAGRLRRVYGEMVGISRVSLEAYRRMCGFSENLPQLDYEYAMVGVAREARFFVKKIEDYVWCEIDDESHLSRATELIYPKLCMVAADVDR